jgi:hypothetical protein
VLRDNRLDNNLQSSQCRKTSSTFPYSPRWRLRAGWRRWSNSPLPIGRSRGTVLAATPEAARLRHTRSQARRKSAIKPNAVSSLEALVRWPPARRQANPKRRSRARLRVATPAAAFGHRSVFTESSISAATAIAATTRPRNGHEAGGGRIPQGCPHPKR